MLLFKLIIVIMLIFIVVTLFTALYQLNKCKSADDSKKIVKTLTVRIAMSLLLFVMLWVGSFFGLITPHGVGG